MDLLSYSAVELAAAIKEGKATAVQAMEAVLARIGETEGTINAYVTIDKEAALAATDALSGKGACGGTTDAGKDCIGCVCRTACGCSGGSEGQPVYEGDTDDLCVKDAWKLCSDFFGGGGYKIGTCRCGGNRKDEHG